jgi:dUTP pyrophosphatase
MAIASCVKVDFLRVCEDAVLPTKGTAGAAAFDLYSRESCTVARGDRALISTGWAVGIPTGYEAQIRPRSGLAARQGVTVLNSPGTIDSDYRGEVKVILANLGEDDVRIRKGDRVAQFVVSPVIPVELVEVASLADTDRGSGGFGSTGT